jgi:NAD(P)-dependent dehydrogenase (short-subunit alcohol dehydrogenase family)
MRNTNEQVWLITGSNKGIGAAIAKEALNQDYKVVAAARKTEGMATKLGASPNLLITELDITNENQVHATVQAAMEQFGQIDVLVNNAGYGQLGYFEELSEEQLRQQMETNVFGTMRLTRAVLPIMRKQRSGTVMVFSSMMGLMSIPGGSVYSASKFALEGWSEGLNTELQPFGIQVMLVEPGPFRTDFTNKQTSAKFSELQIDDYSAQRNSMHDFYFAGKQFGDPAKLAKALMRVAGETNPPFRWLAGKGMVDAVIQHYQRRLAEYESWREVSDHTNFD